MFHLPLPPHPLPQLRPQHPPKNLLQHPPTNPRHRPIKPTFTHLIPNKRMLRPRHLEPAKLHPRLAQRQSDFIPARRRDVRVQCAVDTHQLALDLLEPRQRVIRRVGTECSTMDIRSEIRHRSANPRIQRTSNRQVAAETHTRRAQPSRARLQGKKGIDGRRAVGVVGGEGFLGFEGVAKVGAGDVVGEGGGGDEVVVRGGRGDDVAGGGDGAREAGDGAGDLVDFGEEGDAGEFAGGGGLVWEIGRAHV